MSPRISMSLTLRSVAVRLLCRSRDEGVRASAGGTDWLAFAHLVIAAAFWGPLRDPVRNIWVIEWGMIACAGVVPLAIFAGPVRGIPAWWSAIDISFGVFGIVPLLVVYRMIKRLGRADGDNQVAPEKPLPTIRNAG
jgi:hypothetical protein